jgi:periplasmic divalent cation tolerance protein
MLVEKIHTEDKNLVFIYTTCTDRNEARIIGLSCIRERLAVSADFWAINSIYPWQNVIQDVDQFMLVLTTQKILSQRLMKFIEGIHSYAVPVIAESDIQVATQAYKFWIEQTLENNTAFLTTEEYEKQETLAEEGVFHPGQLK